MFTIDYNCLHMINQGKVEVVVWLNIFLFYFLLFVLLYKFFSLSRIAESEGDGNTIATEKDRLDVELDVYVANKDQVVWFYWQFVNDFPFYVRLYQV